VLAEHQQAAASEGTPEAQLRDQPKRTPTADEIFAGLSLPRETERQDHSPRGSADLQPISRRDRNGRFKAARESMKPWVRPRLLICAAVSVALIAVIATAAVLGNSPIPTRKSKASVAAASLGESPKPTTRTAPRDDIKPRRQPTREPSTKGADGRSSTRSTSEWPRDMAKPQQLISRRRRVSAGRMLRSL